VSRAYEPLTPPWGSIKILPQNKRKGKRDKYVRSLYLGKYIVFYPFIPISAYDDSTTYVTEQCNINLKMTG
jgi:hypothetical protein